MIDGFRVAVTDAATEVVAGRVGSGYRSVVVVNPTASGADVDLGGPDVVSGQGLVLAQGDRVTLQLERNDELFAIAPAAASATLQVLEAGY